MRQKSFYHRCSIAQVTNNSQPAIPHLVDFGFVILDFRLVCLEVNLKSEINNLKSQIELVLAQCEPILAVQAHLEELHPHAALAVAKELADILIAWVV